MQPELQCGFEGIEKQRVALTQCVLALSGDQLDWTQQTDAWSIQQIIQHLVLSDETVGQARNTDTGSPEPLPLRLVPHGWRLTMVLNAFKRDIVLPLPSPDVEPREDAPLPSLLSRWDEARLTMRRDLEAMSDGKTPYFHPILGRLSAMQMLELSETHTAYHTRQIESLQRNAAFPRGGREDS